MTILWKALHYSHIENKHTFSNLRDAFLNYKQTKNIHIAINGKGKDGDISSMKKQQNRVSGIQV